MAAAAAAASVKFLDLFFLGLVSLSSFIDPLRRAAEWAGWQAGRQAVGRQAGKLDKNCE
jgi:hypothetical protein